MNAKYNKNDGSSNDIAKNNKKDLLCCLKNEFIMRNLKFQHY